MRNPCSMHTSLPQAYISDVLSPEVLSSKWLSSDVPSIFPLKKAIKLCEIIAVCIPRYRRRISENQLVCDCHLRWLSRWLMSQPTLALYTECRQPLRLNGRQIVELQEDDFTCAGKYAQRERHV